TMAVPTGMFSRPIAAAGGQVLGPASQLLLGSAAGGAASAALSPVTSEESRGGNMLAAGVLGAAIPGAGKAGPALWRGGRNLLTDAGARTRALQTVAEHRGPASQEFLERLGLYEAPTIAGQQTGLPISAAQASGNARMAQLEAASRSRPGTQPNWADFDAAQNAQRWQALENLTPSELRLDRLERARTLATAPAREAALGAAQQAGGFILPGGGPGPE